MTVAFRLWENGHLVELLDPATDSAGRTSSYVTMQNAQKAYVVCHIQQGAANTILLSVLQGQGSAGANPKAINACPIVSNLDTATSDVLVSRTAAATYTTDAGVKNKIVIFEIDPVAHLDVNNATPFDHIAVSTGSSSASNLTSALLVLLPVTYAQFPAVSTTGV